MSSSSNKSPEKPRVGVVGMAYAGYNLGEELGPAKLDGMLQLLASQPVEAAGCAAFVTSETQARAAGCELAARGVDCILAVITTFVPDSFIVELLDACDVPVFLWCVEREMSCISVVCGPLITATLYNLEKRYDIVGADIPCSSTHSPALGSFLVFARAAMLQRLLRTLRVGYCGGKCPIMFSMATDEYALKRMLGTTVVTLPVEEFYDLARAVPDSEARAAWDEVRNSVGEVTALEADGLMSSRHYLAAIRLAGRHQLDALSLNCFPHLKSRICLGVAKLNDAGIAAACEGDLHSTILMCLLSRLTGRATFNGDWLRMYPETNEVLFSHCGAGAFSLAGSPADVCLRCSIETRDGLAVCYATQLRGPLTLANLMMGPAGGLRLATMCGEGVETDLQYEGTPLKVRFADSPDAILRRISRCGAGHHWNGAGGDFTRELELVCEWRGVKFSRTDKEF